MSSNQYGFMFEPELCIQCHACEVACKSWRGLDVNVKWRRVTGGFAGTFPNTKLMSASISCMHCVSPACMDVCPTKAIFVNEQGLVLVKAEDCVGCHACEKACPFGAPQFGTSGVMEKCDMCCHDLTVEPPCVNVCPNKALARILTSAEEKGKKETQMLAHYSVANKRI